MSVSDASTGMENTSEIQLYQTMQGHTGHVQGVAHRVIRSDYEIRREAHRLEMTSEIMDTMQEFAISRYLAMAFATSSLLLILLTLREGSLMPTSYLAKPIQTILGFFVGSG